MDGEPQGRLRQSEHVVARRIADQWLLIPIHGTGADLQKVYLLNETSAAIWQTLQQPMTFAQLVASLQTEYDAPGDLLREDAGEFVADLLSRGFLIQETADE